jgi:hypothetical protein
VAERQKGRQTREREQQRLRKALDTNNLRCDVACNAALCFDELVGYAEPSPLLSVEPGKQNEIMMVNNKKNVVQHAEIQPELGPQYTKASSLLPVNLWYTPNEQLAG